VKIIKKKHKYTATAWLQYLCFLFTSYIQLIMLNDESLSYDVEMSN